MSSGRVARSLDAGPIGRGHDGEADTAMIQTVTISEMTAFEIDTEAPRIVQALAKTMSVGPGALCICGTGRPYGQCCSAKPGRQLAFSKTAFDAVLRYRDSQGGTVEIIPQGLFKQFQQAAKQRLSCLYPRCPRVTSSCHLIPESVLRSSFGGHCLEYRLQDVSTRNAFVRTGVGEAGTSGVFCSEHDNDLFTDVDKPVVDFTSHKHLFLLAFKAIAFSLRKVQHLLGIDFQVEVFRPWLLSANPNLQRTTNFQIDISHFHERYRRFVITYDAFVNAVEALDGDRWDYFSHLHRSIDREVPMFFADFMNPSHDLNGQRIGSAETPINMTCSVWTQQKQSHVTFACPGGPSEVAYAGLLEQLRKTDDDTFAVVINNLLTAANNQPLLPLTFEVDKEQLDDISALRAKAGECLKSSSAEIFDLSRSDGNVTFF